MSDGGFDFSDIGDGGWDFGEGFDMESFFKSIGIDPSTWDIIGGDGGLVPGGPDDPTPSQPGNIYGDPSFNWQFDPNKFYDENGQEVPEGMGFSGKDLSSLLKSGLAGAGSLIGGAGSLFGKLLSNGPILQDAGALYAAIKAAKQYGDQADNYITKSEEWGKEADTFGPERQFYQKQLKDLYADPSSIQNTPGYKFTLDQALGAVNNDARQRGTGGFDASGVVQTGTLSKALMDRAAGLASTTYNTEADRLSKLSGAQFDGGANAAGIKMGGLQAADAARRAALAAQTQAYGQLARGVTTGNGGIPDFLKLIGEGLGGLGGNSGSGKDASGEMWSGPHVEHHGMPPINYNWWEQNPESIRGDR